MMRRLRKLALALHLTFAIGWLGALLGFLAVAITSVATREARILRAGCLIMHLMASYVIVPLAFTALLSGLVSALITKWGLFRHYWVVTKLGLATIAVVVLLIQLRSIAHLADRAADPSSTVDLLDARRPLIHAAGGLLVLLVIEVLGIYKPWGMTRYGLRKRREQSARLKT